MKNIHLLPTDKASRLYEFGGQIILTNELTDAFRNQNIYITSDEEIKEGDLVTDGKLVGYYSFDEDGCPIIKSSKDDRVYGFGLSPHSKKIILTTDQDLIKDGVQAIDDDFLEWFVKNPSCQYGGYKNIDWDKIITQKEEPKQETLEEVAEKVAKLKYGPTIYGLERVNAFKDGAKWQQERMYSKEDMEYAFKSSSLTNVLDVYESFEEFIGQYKKK
jgi:hypothetical protein